MLVFACKWLPLKSTVCLVIVLTLCEYTLGVYRVTVLSFLKKVNDKQLCTDKRVG